jgi:hypothetical protein
VVSELIFGFRGTPLLLRVWLGLDISSLSWVCDKHGFSGRFCSRDLSVERGMDISSRIEIEKFNGGAGTLIGAHSLPQDLLLLRPGEL